MITDRTPDYVTGLVHELRKLPNETEWLEFKRNDASPQDIGEYLSALANSAALYGKTHGYMVWGIDDATHEIVGTTFNPVKTKVGNEELENWLLHLLNPKIDFRFHSAVIDGSLVILLEVGRAFQHPVQFQNQEFIRIGTYKKKLKDFPEKERALWRVFDQTPFETLIAVQDVASNDVLSLLDYPAYFELLNLPLPANRDAILKSLLADELIARSERGNWHISNLGAILLAKKLDEFPSLRRKATRVIAYRGNSRVETLREQMGVRGYANGFEGLIGYVNGLLPTNEVIQQALRKTVPMYPELAVRELVANALIHQDFSVTGAGPMVEIFEDRMEVSNPGVPLVEVLRFLDSPPRSRNETLASFMRRIGVCEERGSGVDKVVFQTELFQLPAPAFEVVGESTRALLFAHRPLSRMDKADRIRACYLHACLRYVNRDFMTNTTLRNRFGIEAKNSAMASRLIKEAIEAGVVHPHDEAASKRLMKYVPFWA